MKIKLKITICTAALLLFGCSSGPDIEVSISPDLYQNAIFDIQAIGENVVVKDVSVNRGNCELHPAVVKRLAETIEIKLGEHFRGGTRVQNSCRFDSVKEVEVTTNAGAFTFSF